MPTATASCVAAPVSSYRIATSTHPRPAATPSSTQSQRVEWKPSARSRSRAAWPQSARDESACAVAREQARAAARAPGALRRRWRPRARRRGGRRAWWAQRRRSSARAAAAQPGRQRVTGLSCSTATAAALMRARALSPRCSVPSVSACVAAYRCKSPSCGKTANGSISPSEGVFIAPSQSAPAWWPGPASAAPP
jgi:hypothetical protein